VPVSGEAGAALVARTRPSGTVVNRVSDWDHYDGTSTATPHVTGVIALIWSTNLGLSSTTVENHLFSTCTDLGAAGYDTAYGRGIVNASGTVSSAGR
jgi:serine protease